VVFHDLAVVVLWVFFSQLIEILMLEGLSGSNALVGVHFKHHFHQVYLCVIHYRRVPSFKSFWRSDFRKLQSLIASVPIEFLLQKIWQRTQHFLDYKQLVYFRISWKERLAVHQLTHYAAHCPNVHFFSIGHVIRNKEEFTMKMLWLISDLN
jgi:hypothetical protein